MSRIYLNWPTTKYKSGCEKLNKEWHGIEIQATFPVESGTVVEVSCSDRRMFPTGSIQVTCHHAKFKYEEIPNCEGIGRRYFNVTNFISVVIR